VPKGSGAAPRLHALMTAAGGCNSVPRRRLRTKASVGTTLRPPLVAGVGVSTASLSAPTFRVSQRHTDYVVVEGVLDTEMLEKLEQFLKRKRPRPAKMKNEGGNSDDERKARYDDRDSKVSWFNARTECSWLHDRLAEVARTVANVEWPMLQIDPTTGQLKCDYDDTQYAVYGPQQHFKAWHQDAYADGHDPEDARQITLVVMISDRQDYTGGFLQAKIPGPNGNKIARSLRLDAGDVAVFPAKRLAHRVTAVNTGIRKTLVFWVSDKASCHYHRDRMKKQESTTTEPETISVTS